MPEVEILPIRPADNAAAPAAPTAAATAYQPNRDVLYQQIRGTLAGSEADPKRVE